MTDAYRVVAEKDGEQCLLEATTEIREATKGEWWWDSYKGAVKCNYTCGTSHEHPILRELCKIEVPDGYELVNEGLKEFELQTGDKFIALDGDGVDWNAGRWNEAEGIIDSVRAPVCRPIAKENPKEECDVRVSDPEWARSRIIDLQNVLDESIAQSEALTLEVEMLQEKVGRLTAARDDWIRCSSKWYQQCQELAKAKGATV